MNDNDPIELKPPTKYGDYKWRYSDASNTGLRAPVGIGNSEDAKRWNAYCAASASEGTPPPVKWWTKLYRVFFSE